MTWVRAIFALPKTPKRTRISCLRTASHRHARRPSRRPWCGNRLYQPVIWCSLAFGRGHQQCGTKRRVCGQRDDATPNPMCLGIAADSGCRSLHATTARRWRTTRPAPRNTCRCRRRRHRVHSRTPTRRARGPSQTQTRHRAGAGPW